MRSIIKTAAVITAFAATATEANAQGQGPATVDAAACSTATAAAGVITYEACFFAAYAPVTVLDLVSRIPGFSLSDGNTGRRGLGDSFGNMLIDGVRPSNKSLSLQTVLERIPAGDVERVELIQEALPQYDMRGHARLVNIVLREGAGNSGSWRSRISHWDSGRITPEAEVSYTRRIGASEVTLGLNSTLQGRRFLRRERLTDPAGSLIEVRDKSDQRRFWEVGPSLSFNTSLDDVSTLRFDARGSIWEWRRNQASHVAAPSGPDLMPSRYDRSDTTNHGSSYTATLTYGREISDAVSIETMILATRRRWQDGPEAFESYDPVNFTGATIVEYSGTQEETAFRQTLSWVANERHALEFGAEAAFNARDTLFTLAFDDGTTITPINVPGGDTRVEERRSEVFANHVWTISDDWSLESGLRYEFSTISQSGDVTQERSFAYPKPSVTLSWRANEQTRWRFAMRRDVAQLEFGKFASSIDVNNQSSTFGNPDYQPQRTWTLEAEWERRVGADGSVSIKVGRDWIEGLDDFEARLDPVSGAYFDVPGNIGDGTIDRVTLNWTSPLDRIGLANAVLTGFIEWYGSNVTDPLTGVDRHFSHIREWELRLDFRQTFPARQIAWGWDYFWLSDGEVFRANDYYQQGFSDGDLDLYVETTRWLGVTTRLGIDFALDNGADTRRVRYVPVVDASTRGRQGGVIRDIEQSNQSEGPTIYVQMRGTF